MSSVQHYNDWPNTQGVSSFSISPTKILPKFKTNTNTSFQFDVRHQELEPKELTVKGDIPAYCAGVLLRNGLGPRSVETDKNGEKTTVYKTSHWFDSFAQVHRFQIHAPTPDSPKVRVTHNSRLTSDGVVERVKRTGSLNDFTFGAKRDPCKSLFQKAQALFAPVRGDGKYPGDVNVSVALTANFPGLSRSAERVNGRVEGPTLINKTDSTMMQALDPETLEPIGVASQKRLHPDLAGPLSAAHASTCPKTGDVFNYNLELGRYQTYRVFVVSAATGETSILATIKYPAAYLHSLFLSENYVILCVWNCFYSMGGVSTLWTRNLAEAFAPYDKTKPATWFVIDRKPGGRGLVKTFESDAFYAFHTINAYEVEGKGEDASEVDIVADVCTFDNIDSITRLYIDNLLSDSPAAKKRCEEDRFWSARYSRYRLAGVPSSGKGDETTKPKRVQLEYQGAAELGGPELPSINEAYRARKHRFVYGVTATGKSTFLDGLVKLDVDTGETICWSRPGQTASEPIFVADPDPSVYGILEDAGVLLTVVLDGIQGESYLLVLNAKDMTEVARADVGGVVGFGFHGLHLSASL